MYGTVGFITNCFTTRFLTDQWGRRKYVESLSLLQIVANYRCRMILAGLSGIIVVEIYSAIMQWKFQNTTNTVGKGFAILGIYLFSVIYCKSRSSDANKCGV